MLASQGSDNQNVVLIIANICTGLSLLAELIALFLFLRSWKLRTPSGKMVLYLTLSYFYYTVANVLVNFEDRVSGDSSVVCQIDGFLRVSGLVSCFFWAFKITKTSCAVMMGDNYRFDTTGVIMNIIFGALVPMVMALLPMTGMEGASYRFVDLNCSLYFPASSDSKLKFFIGVFVIEFLPMFILFVSVVYFGYRMRQLSKGGIHSDFGVKPNRILMYPMGLLFIWITNLAWVIINYLYQELFWLDLVRVILTRSSGCIHSLIYIAQNRRLTAIDERRKSQFLDKKRLKSGIELSSRSDTGQSFESVTVSIENRQSIM